MNALSTAPILSTHAGIAVVRDDLFPGGTKARFMARLFEGADELVYASPQEGGAQTAIAHCARALGKRATIFVARRRNPHPRVLLAKALGARMMQVSPGYLTVVQKRAAEYAAQSGARLLPFGGDCPEALEALAAAARALEFGPDEVWCAAGSGVLARSLAAAWPAARRHVVQVGHALNRADVAGATIHVYPRRFEQEAAIAPPFPADPHYDAKAWETAAAQHGPGRVLFWNVAGPAARIEARC